MAQVLDDSILDKTLFWEQNTMSNMIKSSLFAIAILSLSISNLSAADELSIEQKIQQAENGRLKAKELGFEWSTTSILINNAKKAIEAGDKANAKMYAEKAINEANLSLKQAKYAEKNWKKYAL